MKNFPKKKRDNWKVSRLFSCAHSKHNLDNCVGGVLQNQCELTFWWFPVTGYGSNRRANVHHVVDFTLSQRRLVALAADANAAAGEFVVTAGRQEAVGHKMCRGCTPVHILVLV